jgi:ubiquinol-cytochrome c reductase iron-sulfur subunit
MPGHDGRRSALPGALSRLIAAAALLRAWRRRRRPPPALRPPVDPAHRDVSGNRRAESIVIALLLGAAALALGFLAAYALDENTQLLGLALGLAFALLAAALVIAGKAVVPQETAVEERAALERPDDVDEVAGRLAGAREGVSRRGLLLGAGGVAGAAVGGALVAPAASLGPKLGGSIHETPWRRGRRLVDTDERRYRPRDIAVGSSYTALPEGARSAGFGAGLVVVRLPGEMLELPPERRDWAPEGILAFSKICPHAGCAISLYRWPLYEPTSDGPALVCPCHYSTFDPATGGRLIFGPAGRSLPQLPLMVDADGYLAAAGPFPEDVGPSWWHVRRP